MALLGHRTYACIPRDQIMNLVHIYTTSATDTANGNNPLHHKPNCAPAHCDAHSKNQCN